jgi:hypothetical protein
MQCTHTTWALPQQRTQHDHGLVQRCVREGSEPFPRLALCDGGLLFAPVGTKTNTELAEAAKKEMPSTRKCRHQLCGQKRVSSSASPLGCGTWTIWCFSLGRPLGREGLRSRVSRYQHSLWGYLLLDAVLGSSQTRAPRTPGLLWGFWRLIRTASLNSAAFRAAGIGVGNENTAPTGAREGPVSLFTGVRRQSSKQELLGVTSEEGAQLTIAARWCISGINKAYFAQGACGALAALVSRREGAPVDASGVAREWEGAAGTRTHRLGRSAIWCC